MRDIKFRAWDKDAKEMLSHEQINQLDKDGIVHLMDIIKPNNNDGITIMQFTGLHDKNGKEIYEGDIIKWGQIVRMVVFKDGSFRTVKSNGSNSKTSGNLHSRKIHFFKMEVIGNIYEHPELLTSLT